MFPAPDWQQSRMSLSSIQSQLCNHKITVGWNEGETDTALVVEVYSTNDTRRPRPVTGHTTEYDLYVWNRLGIRSELSALLGLSVTKVDL